MGNSLHVSIKRSASVVLDLVQQNFLPVIKQVLIITVLDMISNHEYELNTLLFEK